MSNIKCLVVGIGASKESLIIKLATGEIGTVPKVEVGGNAKNRAHNMIGASIEVVKKADHYSRKDALEYKKKTTPKLKAGDTITVNPYTVMEGFIIVEACGEEVFLKINDVSLYYVDSLKDIITLGEEYKAKVISLNPLKLTMKDDMKVDVSMYQRSQEFLTEVTGVTKDGIFCELPAGGQVMCYPVDWIKQPRRGDKVIVTIRKKDDDKGQVWGNLTKTLVSARR